jgi:hypothetical protein
MRTLNRPMFRYGGPIKEGVMHGIREPKRNGGSMVKQAALVGNPAYPQTAGREHHRFNIFGLGSKGANVAKVGTGGQTSGIITQALKNFYNKARSKITTIPKTRTNTPQGPRPDGTPMFKTQTNIPMTERIKMFAKANPKTTIGAGTVGMTSGVIPDTVGAIGTGIKNTGFQIADLLVSDKYFDQDKYFADKEKAKLEKDIKTSTETANEKRIKELEALLAAPASKNQGKTQDEIRQDRIQKYRDIMDIKGMNKNAAYDSLIAASQAVNQSGDFKGDLKSGKLINQIIQSTSKAFDKPKATKDAIDTLILKGEIESDIAAGKPSTYLKAAQDMVATGAAKNITEAMKTLTKSENSMSTTLGAILAKGNRLDEKTVGVAYREETGNIPAGSIKISEVNEWKEENKGKNEIDYVKEIMKVSELAPGDYIIGERVVTIDENMKPTFFY